jgi:uncharacterized protein YkwD
MGSSAMFHGFLRVATALVALTVVAACSTGADSGSLFRSPLSTQAGTVDAGEAAALISAYRKSRGLPPVTVDPTLTRIAAAHARRMASADKMAHVLPGEGSFQQRLAAGGFQASMAAENVAAGQKSLGDVLESWRKSPGHNANLLLPNVSKIGIALSIAPDSRYKTYWSLVLGEWFVPGPGGGIASAPGAGPLLFPTGAMLETH